MGTSGGGWAFDDGDDPTVVESREDTAPHDLSAVARVLSAAGDDREALIRLVWSEAHEDAVRALYDLLRRYTRVGMSRGEMDNFVLALRQRFTRL